MPDISTTRLLVLEEVEDYIVVVRAADADSGRDGGPHSHVYSKGDLYDVSAAVTRETRRWEAPLDQVGWRRGWGCFAGAQLVGSLYLAGGQAKSELHRVEMGMGVIPDFRGMGGGSGLLDCAINWARAQDQIAWIDLGVFGDNPRAQALYEKIGFEVVGRRPDRFRVDGVMLENVSMSLYVGKL